MQWKLHSLCGQGYSSQCSFHGIRPLLARISAPQKPCDDAVTGVIGIAEIEAPLIHLVPREVADHAQDGALAEGTAIFEVPRPRHSDHCSPALPLSSQPQTFRSVPGNLDRGNEVQRGRHHVA